MVDRLFSDARLAALYDTFNARERRRDFDFYLPRVMAANAVLDVGCGTGMLLHHARELGHRGRLCGLDPAGAMLDRARRRPDVEWVLGDLSSAAWDREFDLIVMTGHTFQVLVTDGELRASLGAVRQALVDGGCFAFETRNPLCREWERWTPDRVGAVTDAMGVVVRCHREVEAVEGELVRFALTYESPGWDGPVVSQSTLRFIEAVSLSTFLSAADLAVEEQFGDWDGQPITATSREIITIARRPPSTAAWPPPERS